MSMGDSLKETAALDELIDALLSAKSQQQVGEGGVQGGG